MFDHLFRDIRSVVNRDGVQNAIPPLDGALSPNDRLDACTPIGEAAWYSAFNWNGFGKPTNWIGLDNYRFVLQTRAFWLALRNNGLIIAVSLIPLILSLRRPGAQAR